MNEKSINIIIDDKDEKTPIFIEIENEDGESINIGQRVKRSDGYSAIVITYRDFIKALSVKD